MLLPANLPQRLIFQLANSHNSVSGICVCVCVYVCVYVCVCVHVCTVSLPYFQIHQMRFSPTMIKILKIKRNFKNKNFKFPLSYAQLMQRSSQYITNYCVNCCFPSLNFVKVCLSKNKCCPKS
jgi:hypothetical protein